MRLLIDTHIFLWAIQGSASLKSNIRRIISEAEQVYVSAASIWEIAIKARLGKVEVDAASLVEAIGESGFFELPVRVGHAAGVAELPLLHSDPFDRLLVAQAMAEPLKFLTADPVLAQYSALVMLI